MTDYIIDCGFEKIRVRANLEQASAPILLVDDNSGETQATRLQTADARHLEHDMAVLVISWLGPQWYLPQGEEEPEDEDAYISGLIRSIRKVEGDE